MEMRHKLGRKASGSKPVAAQRARLRHGILNRHNLHWGLTHPLNHPQDNSGLILLQAEGATSGGDAAHMPAEDTAAVVPAEAAKLKLRQPAAASHGGAAAQRLAKSAGGQKRQRGGTKAGDAAQGAAKQQRGPAAAANAAAAAAAAAAADDGGGTDLAPVLKVRSLAVMQLPGLHI